MPDSLDIGQPWITGTEDLPVLQTRQPAVPFEPTPWNLAGLTRLSRWLPPIRGAASLAFWCIRPLYRGQGLRMLPIWPGVRMLVDPQDYLGGLLAFLPHVYDRWERQAMARILRPGDVFVDVGGNIGAYTLWAARCVGSAGKVIAIEADEENYGVLAANVGLNRFEDRITLFRCGVSERREVLSLHRNVTGNCGGHTFSGEGAAGPLVECVPLDELLAPFPDLRIRMMKLDIEGFEAPVLGRYFSRVPLEARPEYLLVEIDGGPAPVEQRAALRSLLTACGYAPLRESANSLFKRTGGSR
jgi:FkbM family methyltransferase